MNVFAVLADPIRVQVIEALAGQERTVTELVTVTGTSQPTVSRHLRVLREAGMVTARVDGPRRIYRLDPRPLQDLDRWLDRYRRLWAVRLDRLDAHLDETEEP